MIINYWKFEQGRGKEVDYSIVLASLVAISILKSQISLIQKKSVITVLEGNEHWYGSTTS